jgi:membrane protease YdiL (CAAX protease family)
VEPVSDFPAPLDRPIEERPGAMGVAPERARLVALFEVLLCSGFPTQLVIGQALVLAGYSPFGPDGTPAAGPLFALALIDSVVLVGLITALLWAHGESLGWLLVGTRRVRREIGLGLLLVPALFLGVGLTVLLLQRLLPFLHNVPSNPLEQLMRTPGEAGAFALVAIVAGGLREEVQRAFLLRRFERHLGGPAVGLAIVSVAFGAGHVVQGWDAAIATGLLGLTWGFIYLRRNSAVAPIVSHAGYNTAQILQVVAVRSMGG